MTFLKIETRIKYLLKNVYKFLQHNIVSFKILSVLLLDI